MAGFELFGYRIGKIQDEKKSAEQVPSFAPPPNNDGAIEVAPGGSYGTFVDLEGTAKNEAQLVTKYRELSLQFEVDNAVDEIINEAIIREDNKSVVEINMDNLNAPDKVKDKIREEFKTVVKLLDFNNMAYDVFRRWYIDGRIYYHMMIDEKKVRDGIKELRYIDPRRIRKIREQAKKTPGTSNSKLSSPAYLEYYLYLPSGMSPSPGVATQGIKISKDSIAYVHSGLLNQNNKMILSYLHTAMKPMNQLRMLEDASVIYRLARAPERRIFYIDVGNLPKLKAEQYLRDMMVKHKNRLVYDASTGEVRDDRKFMTMLEDFWLPRRDGGKGTEITTLPGGQNLGEMEDIEYFRRKLYKALRVPITRIQSDNTFNFGRSGEITRDEIKFAKFVDRLRTRFGQLFDIILETQLVLRGVMTRAEWKEMKEYIHYDFLRDNYFAELKDQEIVNARLGILQTADQFVGRYFSAKYVRLNVLKMTEEQILEMDREIAEEGGAQAQEGGPEGEMPGKAPAPGLAGPPDGTPNGPPSPRSAPKASKAGKKPKSFKEHLEHDVAAIEREAKELSNRMIVEEVNTEEPFDDVDEE